MVKQRRNRYSQTNLLSNFNSLNNRSFKIFWSRLNIKVKFHTKRARGEDNVLHRLSDFSKLEFVIAVKKKQQQSPQEKNAN
uniref:Uncharacterized protein n=1 Tax=Trichobilharzia regenti TaxID=157069 RepID=A0AA85IQX2_TRIRE|nr:unnamed protein product [Trichobilharzia regenti]